MGFFSSTKKKDKNKEVKASSVKLPGTTESQKNRHQNLVIKKTKPRTTSARSDTYPNRAPNTNKTVTYPKIRQVNGTIRENLTAKNHIKNQKNAAVTTKVITATSDTADESHDNMPKTGAKVKYVPPSNLVKHTASGHILKEKEKHHINTHTKSSVHGADNNRMSVHPHGQNNFYVPLNTMNRLLKKNTQELMSSLTPEVRKAFETLFDRIDVSDSGGITAKEIKNLILKYTNKLMTIEEVRNVLEDLDMKGTGDIEFDEFIFMLSQPENYVRLLDLDELKKIQNDIADHTLKQKLKELTLKRINNEHTPTDTFFKALRIATQQDSMTALRTFYRNRLKKLNDHVIHDWSAGQRCIGLSDQEMLKRYETIQGELLRQRVNFCKDNSYRSSPYARPLEWGLVTLREGIEERRLKLNQEIQKIQTERRAKISEFVCTPKAVPLPKYEIYKRHPLKKTFDYDQLAFIRQKVDKIASRYYSDLKDIAGENSKIVRKELAVEDIKAPTSRENFNWTFKAYCAPFVVSPWIPMPSPTLQASFAPLGRSKLAVYRKW